MRWGLLLAAFCAALVLGVVLGHAHAAPEQGLSDVLKLGGLVGALVCVVGGLGAMMKNDRAYDRERRRPGDLELPERPRDRAAF